ncbi:tRNA pseudouridine synthase A [Planctomycetales bacterium]|nr:tRNA pseudouridine synthase A [Planctomycetales bacterium]
MRRIKLELSYDGTRYSGWQRQVDVPSIQETIEKVLCKITGQAVSVTGSGRTDAGVHALKQVAAFSTESLLSTDVFFRALNGFLPNDIRVLKSTEVPLTFHPIADAVSKRYRYLIDDNRPHNPLTRNYCWQYKEPLALETMKGAAQYLLGEHDFSSFQTQGSPRKTTVRKVVDVLAERLEPGKMNSGLICIEIEANGFLYNMMRTIAGTLALLGVEGRRGKANPKRMKTIIEECRREVAGPTAPPCGLYLIDVRYEAPVPD